MTQTNGNGTKRRINGSKLGYGSRARKSRTYVTPEGDTSTSKEKSQLRYTGEQIVGYMGLALLMGAGWQLATVSADSVIMMWGQRLGFVASTIFIMILKHKLSSGRYIGPQRRYAEKLFYGGVAFESFTLMAKYFSALVPGYLFIVGFSIPGLIIAAFQVMVKDPKRRLEILEEENRIMKKQLREERDLLRIKSEMMKELTGLRADEKIEDKRNDKRIKLATKSTRRINRIAIAENETTLKQLEVAAGVKKPRKPSKKVNVSDAKVIEEKHTRKQKGPRATTAPNGLNCKNPKCNNKLTGNQKVACSPACRTAYNRSK